MRLDTKAAFLNEEMDTTINNLLGDQLAALALPLYLLAMVVEALVALQQQRYQYQWRDTFASLSMLVTTGVIEILPKALALSAFVVLHEISPLRDVIERQWWAWVLLFFLDDLTYYGFHRANHEVRLFWAGHVNHHSSEHLNFGTALRQGVGERLHKYLFWLWLPLLGFDALMLVTMMSLSLFYQFWVHTEWVRRLPVLFEVVFNTPSHHRVHHASNVRYLDRNHAGVLIVWDKWFGTFAAERLDEPCVYGLTTNLASYNPVVVLTHEYAALARDMARATTWADRWRYLWKAPGWSHDGEDRRANVLRQRLL